MESDMEELLASLPHDIVIVSGSTIPQMQTQIPNLAARRLGQNGNHAFDLDGTELWREALTDEHRTQIHDHIAEVTKLLDHELRDEWNPIEDRGAQITFSPIGNTAPIEHKKTYDPDRSKRKALLETVPFESADLVVKIGGSTSFDYFHKDKHKGSNVARVIDHCGWLREDCLYFGDGLYPGGNDEAMMRR